MRLVVNPNNAAAIELRKQIILDIIAELGRKPASRQMAKLLKARGLSISHVQVFNYCKQMQFSQRERPQLLLHGERPTL